MPIACRRLFACTGPQISSRTRATVSRILFLKNNELHLLPRAVTAEGLGKFFHGQALLASLFGWSARTKTG